jgi:hypothetical protein
MFFFRKPKLVVDAFTSETYQHAFDYAPVDYAIKFYPDWWKKLPTMNKPIFANNRGDIVNKTNMKYCEGLTNEYRNSIIIPLWTDFMFKLDRDGSWVYNFSDGKTNGDCHEFSQRIGFKEKYLHFKIGSPWAFKSDKNVYFQTTMPYYNYDKELDYENIPGTVDFHHQHTTNINLFIKKPSEFLINFNTPMFHIKPLSERTLVLRKHIVSIEEFKSKFIPTPFVYQKRLLMTKIIKENNKKKCPFGFGK